MEMAAKARSIVILDHHKTAAEDLAEFREPAPFRDWKDGGLHLLEGDPCPIAALFDMSRSGAGLAWPFRPPVKNFDHTVWMKFLTVKAGPIVLRRLRVGFVANAAQQFQITQAQVRLRHDREDTSAPEPPYRSDVQASSGQNAY
jgi:hypothetical protein